MILVSACLLGDNCKYNGGNNLNNKVMEYLKDKEYIKVCPEVLGGLSIPRSPSEIINNKVINREGIDVTNYFLKGKDEVLKLIKDKKIDLAIMKANSPSCGYKKIYDGTFSKTLIDGNGILVNELCKLGVKVITENDL